ncbi:unnamed protein product, partial [Musa acuminata subsp. burmannicoides]
GSSFFPFLPSVFDFLFSRPPDHNGRHGEGGGGERAEAEGERRCRPRRRGARYARAVPLGRWKPNRGGGLQFNPNPRDNFLFEDDYGCASLCDDNVDIMQHYSDICAVDAVKIPYVGDKEPLSSLAIEFQSGSPILQEKIKLLAEQYAALRRTRGDGNCFYRSFMYSYL